MQEWEQNYHRRAAEIQEEEVVDKLGCSSSFSSPSLSTLENSYPKLNYSLESSSFTCVSYK
jgi:hypothetical protein